LAGDVLRLVNDHVGDAEAGFPIQSIIVALAVEPTNGPELDCEVVASQAVTHSSMWAISEARVLPNVETEMDDLQLVGVAKRPDTQLVLSPNLDPNLKRVSL
jgi:hypothetical protein